MKWENAELSLIAEIGDGAHASLKRVKSGIPYLTAKNITKNGISYSNIDFISEETYEKYFKEKSNALTKPQKNDILYSIIGSIGGVYCVKDEKIGISSSVAIIRANSELIFPQYLAYFLKSKFFEAQVQAIKGGVAQGFMSIEKLKNVNILYPKNLDYQAKIVSILSAYDDLIESKQKQIKLLEEAAQRLYKEWFVDLRFPGYEDIPIINGMPEGWEEEEINKIFNIKYGKTLPTNKIKNSGKYPVYGANGIIGYYNQKNCNDYVVLITSRGNGSGEVSRTHDKEAFVTNNSFIIMPVNDLIKLPFTYQLMKTINFKRICTGSAQPQLTNKSINILKVVLPSDELVLKFCQYTEIYYEKIENLLSQNKRLIEARDRLLTKLMSGEIEV